MALPSSLAMSWIHKQNLQDLPVRKPLVPKLHKLPDLCGQDVSLIDKAVLPNGKQALLNHPLRCS